MAKKHLDFRLSEEAVARLEKYQTDTKLENTTEALEIILSNILSPENVPNSGASDLLPCKQRIIEKGQLECLNPPTIYKKVKITEISVEICRACQVLSHNLPEKYEIKQAPEEETLDRPRKPITDPTNTDMKKAGMNWCPDGGLWVFSTKCDLCRGRNYAVWDRCQREKYRQKGEQQRANTTSRPSF